MLLYYNIYNCNVVTYQTELILFVNSIFALFFKKNQKVGTHKFISVSVAIIYIFFVLSYPNNLEQNLKYLYRNYKYSISINLLQKLFLFVSYFSFIIASINWNIYM